MRREFVEQQTRLRVKEDTAKLKAYNGDCPGLQGLIRQALEANRATPPTVILKVLRDAEVMGALAPRLREKAMRSIEKHTTDAILSAGTMPPAASPRSPGTPGGARCSPWSRRSWFPR